MKLTLNCDIKKEAIAVELTMEEQMAIGLAFKEGLEKIQQSPFLAEKLGITHAINIYKNLYAKFTPEEISKRFCMVDVK